jgi:hypothetical protein
MSGRLASGNVVALGDPVVGGRPHQSIILVKITIHQRLDLWVAEICPSRPPIAVATRHLVLLYPLLMISHPPISISKGVVAMSC